MEQHWKIVLCCAAVIGTIWVSFGTFLLRGSNGDKFKQARAYFCSEGLLLGATGLIHCGLVVYLMAVQLFVREVDQRTLKGTIALMGAWECSNFLGAFFVLWRFTTRPTWAFELYHHLSAVSCVTMLMLLELPLEMHILLHYAEMQHTFIGAYRFLSYFLQVSPEKIAPWRRLIVKGGLMHDVSKLIVALIGVALWAHRMDLRLIDRVYVTFTCFLGNVVLVNHAMKAFPVERAAKPKVKNEAPAADSNFSKVGCSEEASSIELVCDCLKQKVRVDTRALDGLRGMCAVYIAVGHFLYYSNWQADLDPARLEEFHDEKAKWDLHGGWCLPIFYMLSGFVMTAGYAQTKWALPGATAFDCMFGLFGGSPRQLAKERAAAKADEERAGEAPPQAFGTRTFLRKRLVRLAPLFLITNLMAIAGMCYWGVPAAMIDQDGLPVFVVWMTASVFGLSSWAPRESTLPPNPVTWTISTMFFFYFAFPVIMPYLQRLPAKTMTNCAMRYYVYRMPLMMLMAFTYIWIDTSPVDAYWLMRAFPLCGVPIFMMGCCCAFTTLRDAQAKPGSTSDDKVSQPQPSDIPAAATTEDEAVAMESEGSRKKRISSVYSMEDLPEELSKQAETLESTSDWGSRFVGKLCSLHQADVLFGSLALMFSACVFFRRFGGMPAVSILLRPAGELVNPALYYALMRALVAIDHERSLISRILRSRLFQFLGDISMGMYMVHWPIQTAISKYSYSYDKVWQHRVPIMPAWGTAVALPCSIVLGWILVRLVDAVV